MWRVGILTVSDKGWRGEREDRSGEAIRKLLPRINGHVAAYEIVPDERETIVACLIRMADQQALDLVLTTGGTGLGPRDVTPEATQAVMEREVPGVAEAMRRASLEKTRFALLSRQVSGIRGKTWIINLPGSPKAVQECLEAVLDILPHGLETLQGHVGEHGQG